MADCELLAGCPFFNDKMSDTQGIGAVYKKKYCQGSNADCARYVVFKARGRSAVPVDLYPNMLDRAKKILAS